MKTKQGKSLMPIAYFKAQRVKTLVNYLENCKSSDAMVIFNDTQCVYKVQKMSAASAESMAYTSRRIYRGNYIWRSSLDNLIVYISDDDQFWFVYRVQIKHTNLK